MGTIQSSYDQGLTKSDFVNSAVHRQCKSRKPSTGEVRFCRLYIPVFRHVYQNTGIRACIHIQRLLIPASGNRNSGSGNFNNIGLNGYNWSSTVVAPTSNGNAYNLNLNATGLNTSNNNNRANGFPVRCLQAFTPVVPRTI